MDGTMPFEFIILEKLLKHKNGYFPIILLLNKFQNSTRYHPIYFFYQCMILIKLFTVSFINKKETHFTVVTMW